MRTSYIVSYDISDEKRLRRVFKTMRGFGDRLQYSVFHCDLSDKELIILKAVLNDLINHKEDQVLIINLGPAIRRGHECFDIIGRPSGHLEHQVVVI